MPSLKWPDAPSPSSPKKALSRVPGRPPPLPITKHAIAHCMTTSDRTQLATFAKRAQDFLAAKSPETLLKLENHYDESPLSRGDAPILRGRTIVAPVDDEIAAKGIRLRHLMLDKEPAAFNRVRNTVSNLFHKAHITETKEKLDQFKYLWRVKDVTQLNCPMEGHDLLSLWFNAEMFHGSESPLRQWNALSQQYGPYLRMWLMMSLALKQAATHQFRDFLLSETDIYG